MGDELHRSVKLAMDTGEATSVAAAKQIFEGYRLKINIGDDVARSPTLQSALLTAVNTGRRCFLGGVEVVGNSEGDLLVPWQNCRTIGEAVTDLQGTPVNIGTPGLPQVVIGDSDDIDSDSKFAVRATFNGWCGGVVPLDDGRRLPEKQECTPAGVLAGALAVSEAFQFARGKNAQAGKRVVGLSLWQPELESSWLDAHEPGPLLEHLPARLWLIGLGHLGQAYLWTLGFLPYRDPKEVLLVLQDYDSLVLANDSTSLLTSREAIGQKKTRKVANWCEQRGFRTQIQERRFMANFKIDNEEPCVALCGVDNEVARAALEEVGFTQVIEAGLGNGTEEYLAFQMHCFPGSRSARTHWEKAANTQSLTPPIINQPAYQALIETGLDQCGLTTLANRSVGASFVGASVAAIVVAELLRMAIGSHRYEVIDGSLRCLSYRRVIASEVLTYPFNPGLTTAQISE